MAEIQIRKMEMSDVKDVWQLDVHSFSAPWSKETYEMELTENDYAHYFVMETEGNIIGYVGTWLVIDDAQITNIAIHPNFRGYKLGEKLFGYAMQYVMNNGATRLSLEVRKSNLVAQNLYRKFGLVPGGIRENYYPDNGEDAIVMWVSFQ